MSKDVLGTYFTEISTAEVQDLPEEMDDSTTVGEAKWLAIYDLAAALRAERARVGELETEKKKSESAFRKQWVRDGKHVERVAQERNSALARVAQLEKSHEEDIGLLGGVGLELAKQQKETEDLRKLFHEASDGARFALRRVAELEPDAKLGRMVREMPEEMGLYRNPTSESELYPAGKVWEIISRWGDLSEIGSETYSVPEAALAAAQKEET